MFAPILELAEASPTVVALLDDGTSLGLRFYSFGDAPQGVPMPYAVWRDVSGQPLNHLNDLPTMDNFRLQVDVYSNDRPSVRTVTLALRDALESHAHITRWGSSDRDPVTRNFHYDFDVEFFTPR